MSEEEKMKLRYLKEQRDKQKQMIGKRKNKFNLFDDEDGDEEINFGKGFTHGGKDLRDDFQDEIEQSSEDDGEKGGLEEEFVKLANFGGGDRESKSVKEIHEEVMAKSKAYKMIRQEQKRANEDLRLGLDSDLGEIVGSLQFKNRLGREDRQKLNDKYSQADKSYELIAQGLREGEKEISKQGMESERMRAKQKKIEIEQTFKKRDLKYAQKQQTQANDLLDSE